MSRSRSGNGRVPGNLALAAVTRPMVRPSPLSAPNKTEASSFCGTTSPSRSMCERIFFPPNKVPICGVARAFAARTVSPIESPSNLSSTPVITDRCTEPIFTGRPSDSEASCSNWTGDSGMTCSSPRPPSTSTNNVIATGLPHLTGRRILTGVCGTRRHGVRGLARFARLGVDPLACALVLVLVPVLGDLLLVRLDIVEVEIRVRDLDFVVEFIRRLCRTGRLDGCGGLRPRLVARKAFLRLAFALLLRLLVTLLVFAGFALLRLAGSAPLPPCAEALPLRAASSLRLRAWPWPRPRAGPCPRLPCGLFPRPPCARALRRRASKTSRDRPGVNRWPKQLRALRASRVQRRRPRRRRRR